MQTWCGLTRLGEVVERLGTRLERFTDEHGARLYDLPDALRPDPDTPAPPRFLPEYDNVLLSHADRRRVNPDGHPVPLPPGNGASVGTVLVDGDLRALWRLDRARGSLTITPHGTLTRAQRTALTAEARALLVLLGYDGPVEFGKDPTG
jgi:hypothetical protein